LLDEQATCLDCEDYNCERKKGWRIWNWKYDKFEIK